MSQGGKMTTEVMLMMVIFAMLGLYGIYKYSTAENNSFSSFVVKAQELDLAIKGIKDQLTEQDEQEVVLSNIQKKEIEDLKKTVEELKVHTTLFDSKLRDMEKENLAAQDHMARLRKQQQDLRDRSYPRHIEFNFKHSGPIPIEIMAPTTSKFAQPSIGQATSLSTKQGAGAQSASTISPEVLSGKRGAKPPTSTMKKIKKQMEEMAR